MPMRGKLILLSVTDRKLLRTVARRLRCNESEVIRWALRWYGLAGPWRSPDEPAFPIALSAAGDGVGPKTEEGVSNNGEESK